MGRIPFWLFIRQTHISLEWKWLPPLSNFLPVIWNTNFIWSCRFSVRLSSLSLLFSFPLFDLHASSCIVLKKNVKHNLHDWRVKDTIISESLSGLRLVLCSCQVDSSFYLVLCSVSDWSSHLQLFQVCVSFSVWWGRHSHNTIFLESYRSEWQAVWHIDIECMCDSLNFKCKDFEGPHTFL